MTQQQTVINPISITIQEIEQRLFNTHPKAEEIYRAIKTLENLDAEKKNSGNISEGH